jgi:hypothetical protein
MRGQSGQFGLRERRGIGRRERGGGAAGIEELAAEGAERRGCFPGEGGLQVADFLVALADDVFALADGCELVAEAFADLGDGLGAGFGQSGTLGAELVDLMVGEIDLVMELAADALEPINLEVGAPNAVPTNASALTRSGGLTSFGGSTISISRINADGYPSGNYNGVGIDSAGNVYATYSNGQRQTQYQIALATFNNANALVRTNGEAFRDDPAAGFIGLNQALQGGTGTISANSLENSNVDIGSEFTKMIVAQRSYSANARLITTADEMLQEAVNLKR